LINVFILYRQVAVFRFPDDHKWLNSLNRYEHVIFFCCLNLFRNLCRLSSLDMAQIDAFAQIEDLLEITRSLWLSSSFSVCKADRMARHEVHPAKRRAFIGRQISTSQGNARKREWAIAPMQTQWRFLSEFRSGRKFRLVLAVRLWRLHPTEGSRVLCARWRSCPARFSSSFMNGEYSRPGDRKIALPSSVSAVSRSYAPLI